MRRLFNIYVVINYNVISYNICTYICILIAHVFAFGEYTRCDNIYKLGFSIITSVRLTLRKFQDETRAHIHAYTLVALSRICVSYETAIVI